MPRLTELLRSRLEEGGGDQAVDCRRAEARVGESLRSLASSIQSKALA